MTARTRFVVVLEGAAGADTAHAHTLRFLLKHLLKHRGLKCVDADEESAENFPPSSPAQMAEAPNPAPREAKMADMSKYAGGQFLKAADVQESGPYRVTIVNVVVGERFGRPQADLSDGSILTLNSGNVSRLIRHYGAESNDWRGKEIELDVEDYVDERTNETKQMIVLKPISPPLSSEEKAPVKPQAKAKSKRGNSGDDLNDSIPF
jgi:hypothetical protein